MKFLKASTKWVTWLLMAAFVFGGESIMDAYGIGGYLGIGGCILGAFWLICLDHTVSARGRRR